MAASQLLDTRFIVSCESELRVGTFEHVGICYEIWLPRDGPLRHLSLKILDSFCHMNHLCLGSGLVFSQGLNLQLILLLDPLGLINS